MLFGRMTFLRHPTPGEGGGSASSEGGSKGVTKDDGEKKYTEAEANARATAARKEAETKAEQKLREMDEKRLADVTELAKEKGLSDDRRKKLETEKAELEEKLNQANESVNTEKAKVEGVWKAKLSTVEAERNRATDLFKNATLNNAILSVISPIAYYPPTTLALLRSHNPVLKQIDGTDGSDPSHFVTLFQGVPVADPQTKKIEKKDMTVDEYVTHLRTKQEFKNQWKASVVGGTGSNGGSGSMGASNPNLHGMSRIAAGLSEIR